MQNHTLLSPLKDARVRAAIERIIESPRLPSGGSPSDNPEVSRDPFDYAEYGFSIWPDQGDLIYLLCRGMRATRVVDFADSPHPNRRTALPGALDTGWSRVDY
jgi:hypothetical protein